jgi:SAM-dependent methyltransferase
VDVRAYNRARWDKQVELGNPWTLPASPETIAAARLGEWSVLLTERTPVPRVWFPPMEGLDVLGLACGGGQQCPVFAAAGAHVTVFDNSPQQLGQDRLVAEREGLAIRTVEGDMRDLSAFPDASFDLVFHPVSNVFIHEVRPVWREAFRVLRPDGVLMAGFNNPAVYVYDEREDGALVARFKLPFDSRDLSEEERLRIFGEDSPIEFSHSLADQIGGQAAAGFVLTHLYEDATSEPIGAFMPGYIATRAIKPHG